MVQEEVILQLIKSQQDEILQQQKINTAQAESIKELSVRVQELLSQVAWLNRQLFGRKSEKLARLDPNQLSLFEDQTPKEQQEALIEEARAVAIRGIEQSKAEKKNERRNRKLLEDLPIVEVTIEPQGVDFERYKRIGEERTRSLEFEPGRLYVKEIVRPKYGLKDNTQLPAEGQSAVIIATLPLLPIHKGLPGAGMLAEILLQKYEYHLPFYRQIQSFRHLGLRIADNTLNGWFRPACELLRPLYEELKRQVLLSDYVQVDETILPVINHESRQAKKEYLWVVRSPMDSLVFFHYDDGSRSARTAENLLKPFKGYLQSDGYNAYNIFEGKNEVCLVAHAWPISGVPGKKHWMSINRWPNTPWRRFRIFTGLNGWQIRKICRMNSAGLCAKSLQHLFLTHLKNGWRKHTQRSCPGAGSGRLRPIVILCGPA
jgi:transposase